MIDDKGILSNKFEKKTWRNKECKILFKNDEELKKLNILHILIYILYYVNPDFVF